MASAEQSWGVARGWGVNGKRGKWEVSVAKQDEAKMYDV